MTRISLTATDIHVADAGFTLIEMLVVLAIMSLLIGYAVASMGRGPEAMSDRRAQAEAVGMLRAARMQALRSGQPQTVEQANLAGGGLSIAGGDARDHIVWHADGSSTGGLVLRGGKPVLRVDPLTGAIRDQ